MTLFLGLDVGTTTLACVAIDVDTGALVAYGNVDNAAVVKGLPDGRDELDLEALSPLIMNLLADTVDQLGNRADETAGLAVTGQQHGLVLLDGQAQPVGHAITWRDERVLEPTPEGDETYLARFIAQAGGEESFYRTGCHPAAGFLGPSLFWLQEQGRLGREVAAAAFVPDAAVALLTGKLPPSDPTDGGSSGIFDVTGPGWHWDLIDRLGLPKRLFPPIEQPGQVAGHLTSSAARATGLPPGLPVHVAMGDNQASYLGSVRAVEDTVLLNVGTGGQISALAPRFDRLKGIDTRWFPGDGADDRLSDRNNGRYLLVGAGTFGGRTYAYLQDFFRAVGQAFYDAEGDDSLYQRMNALAGQVPPGSQGVRCDPTFTGTRTHPERRASFSGLSAATFTPAHLTRALLEGVAESFFAYHRRMSPLSGQPAELVGAGNGVRRNPVLARILATRFGMPLQMAGRQEAAATGTAYAAAVMSGALPNWRAAGELIEYETVVEPASAQRL